MTIVMLKCKIVKYFVYTAASADIECLLYSLKWLYNVYATFSIFLSTRSNAFQTKLIMKGMLTKNLAKTTAAKV